MSELWPALGTAFRQSVPFLCALLVLAGVVFFFARCCLVSLPRKGSLEWVALQERRPFSLTLPCHPMARRDALPLVLITAVYAATAFFQLGSFTAPQSALDFGEDQTVTIPLSRTIYLTKLRYFSNLGTGSYNVEVSADGETWYTLWQREDENGNTVDYWAAADGYAPSYALPQEYNDLFKWLEVVPENPQNVRYLRIIGRADKGLLELGELALYDNGVFTEGAGLVAAADPTPLFDEQDTVPEQSSWYNSTYFDEIYHPRTALEHIENVYPYEVSHPPLGKLIISLGIRAFGMTPFGWRFMGALFGVLMLPILYVFLKNLFGKTPVAACGTALFAFDFMHLTQTRIATIDTYGVFFILLMYFFLYRYLALPAGTPFRRCALPLFLSGLFWGIGAASKWTVIYGAVGLAVLYFIGLGCKLREWPAQVPGKLPWLWKVLLFSVLCFVLLPALIYTLSYWPYAAARGNEAGLGGILLEIVSWPFVHLPEVLRGERDLFINDSQNIVDIMLQNQHFMLTYHEGVTASHPYSSRWFQWVVDARPILYYLDSTSRAGEGLKAAFGCFNNPIVCWAGLLAILACAAQSFRRKAARMGFFAALALIGLLSCTVVDGLFPALPETLEQFLWEPVFPQFPLSYCGLLLLTAAVVLLFLGVGALTAWAFPEPSPRALLILVGYLSQLLPWLLIGRTTFEYHYFPSTLFLVLAICQLFDGLVERDRKWKGPVYGLTAGAVALYAAFYPVLIGLMTPTWYTSTFLKWFPSWPF